MNVPLVNFIECKQVLHKIFITRGCKYYDMYLLKVKFVLNLAVVDPLFIYKMVYNSKFQVSFNG